MKWQKANEAPQDTESVYMSGQYEDGEWWYNGGQRLGGVWYSDFDAIELHPSHYLVPNPPTE